MSAPTIDKNQWYHLYVNNDKKQALLGTSLFKDGLKGSVFFNTTNIASSVQRWQIFPVTVNDTTMYTFRSKDSGPNGFMGTSYSEDEETEGKTRASMMRGDIASDRAFWSFGSWGDSTWFLTNVANTTEYHLNKKGSGIMAMSPDIRAPQNGQRWSFDPIDRIDDEKYSSVSLVGVATKSTSTATPTNTPTSSPTPSSTPSPTLSPSTKAAIAASLSITLLLALTVLALVYYKKRKHSAQYTQPIDTYMHDGSSTLKYQVYLDSQAKYEMSGAHVVEVPSCHARAELPAWGRRVELDGVGGRGGRDPD